MENATTPDRPTQAARPTPDGQSDGKLPEKEPSFSEIMGDLVLLESPKTLIFPALFALTFWLMKRYEYDPAWLWVVLWISAVGTGFSLYYLRKVMRSVYGLSEVGIGILGCGVSLSKVPSESNMVAAMGLAGSIYIIVRGLDNFFEGRKQIKPLAETGAAHDRGGTKGFPGS